MLAQRLAFIGGTLSAETNGVVDCVEGAGVRLIKDGGAVAETTSDNYGDFKFDRLDEDSGAYVVEITAKGPHDKDRRSAPRHEHQSGRDPAIIDSGGRLFHWGWSHDVIAGLDA